MNCFLVLGCPRSGTSLVAGVLHKSGISMGKRFDTTKADQNPLGSFEDLGFADLNIKLLWRLGEKTHINPPTDDEILSVPIGEIKDTIYECATRGLVDGVDWGWKDPRTVLMWPLYEPILKSVEAMRVKIIMTHRNPLNIARSWAHWQRLGSVAEGLRLVAHYTERLARIAEATEWPVLHVGFEDWWHNCDEQIERLNAFTRRELNYSHFDEKLWRS